MNCEDCLEFTLLSSFDENFAICDLKNRKIRYFDDETYQKAVEQLNSACPLLIYEKFKKQNEIDRIIANGGRRND